MRYRFAWDDVKARRNVQKHGVSFEEAKSVFLDLFAIESFDVMHSTDEDRFIIVGRSNRDRVLVVAFALPDEETIRLISARQAHKREEQDYEKNSGS